MKKMPIEALSPISRYLHPVQGESACFIEADEDKIDLTKATHVKEAVDCDGNKYIIFRYTCSDHINYGMCLPEEPEITAEDLTEWQASSCGTTYNAYIGKPWLD